MDPQEQVDALSALQGRDHEIEIALAKAPISRVVPFQGGGAHTSPVFIAILEGARACYWKPCNGVARSPYGAQALANYGQTHYSATIAECAAWQLAKRMGSPWDEMVAPTVLRFVEPPDGGLEHGSLSIHREGKDKTRGFIAELPSLAAAAALFDCLIGQQDRNEGNVLWDQAGRRIHLIDHQFSFARPGAGHGELLFWGWRWEQGARGLDRTELDLLAGLQGAAFDDLATFLELERMAALRNRCHRMISTRQLLPPGDY